MFDHLRNAIKRRARRLFRRRDHAQPSASKQQSVASNNSWQKNGVVGSTTGTKRPTERNPTERLNRFDNPERAATSIDPSGTCALPSSTHGVTEHSVAPAIKPISGSSRLEDPGQSLASPEDRASNFSEDSVATSLKASLHTNKGLTVPGTTVSKSQSGILQEEPFISSSSQTTKDERQQTPVGPPRSSTVEIAQEELQRAPMKPPRPSSSETTRDERQQAPLEYAQLTSKAGSRDSLAADSDVIPDEQLHYSLSDEKANASYDEEAANDTDREKAEPKTPDSHSNFDSVRSHADIDFDHTVHTRAAVTHEEVKPHIHTIYEPRRTRSIHFHEHRTLIQPITDPNPTILPEEHWAQDHITGEIFKIPNELGRQLMESEEC